jgi:hypothetical protein
MKTQKLTQSRLKELFHYNPETGVFTRLITAGGQVAGATPGRINTNGYRDISVDGRRYMAHRLAWLYIYGLFPESEIDHINRIKDDNRIANLRIATHKQNAENVARRKSNTSGFPGVDFRYGKWRARISHHGKSIFLGSFDSLYDAHRSRVAAQEKFHSHAPVI